MIKTWHFATLCNISHKYLVIIDNIQKGVYTLPNRQFIKRGTLHTNRGGYIGGRLHINRGQALEIDTAYIFIGDFRDTTYSFVRDFRVIGSTYLFIGDYPPTPTQKKIKKETQPTHRGTSSIARFHASGIGYHSEHSDKRK